MVIDRLAAGFRASSISSRSPRHLLPTRPSRSSGGGSAAAGGRAGGGGGKYSGWGGGGRDAPETNGCGFATIDGVRVGQALPRRARFSSGIEGNRMDHAAPLSLRSFPAFHLGLTASLSGVCFPPSSARSSPEIKPPKTSICM